MAHNPPQVARLRKVRVSPATVIAFVALVIALGGAAYAALKLPKNSVKSKNIVNGQVKAADLAKNAITAKNLKAGSVTGTALAPNAVDGSKIADGSVGGADIAGDAIDSSKVKDGSLTPGDVGSVVLHARGAGDVQTTSAGANYPLDPATWTQDANQPNLAIVTVNYTSPPSCGGFATFAFATIKVDGNILASANLSQVPASTTQNASAIGTLPASAAAESHGLTATVSGQCSGASEVWTVHSISVDVVAFG